MRNVRRLLIDLERENHPAVPVLRAIMDYSNTPDCIVGLADTIKRAAQSDQLEEAENHRILMNMAIHREAGQ